MADPFAAFDTLANALDTLPLATRRAMVGLVEHFSLLLLDLNRDYLRKQGQRPDGEAVQARGYSKPYAAFRAKYGLQTAFVDLKFSGDYLKSFVLEYLGGLQFGIVATDAKAASLFQRYGELLGVREVDVRDFAEKIMEPEIRAFVGRHMDNG